MAAHDPPCQASDTWDFSEESQDHPIFQATAYTSTETTIIAIIVIVSIIGVVANLAALLTLFRHRSKWGDYKCYFPGSHLSWLFGVDLCQIVCVLIYMIAPWYNSPVSYDFYFPYCWILTGTMLATQVFTAGISVLIAVETYVNQPSSGSVKHGIILAIGLIAILSVLCAVPNDVFTADSSKCVRWPKTPEFKDFPHIINPCPWNHFTSFRFVLFHDTLVFYIPAAILTFCYSGVIQMISMSGPTSETVNNLRARILVCVLCHALVRFVNISGASFIWFSGAPLTEYSVASEVGVLILRGLMWLQPVLNPFVYFLTREVYRPLVMDTFGFRAGDKLE